MSIAEQIDDLRSELRRRSFIGGRIFFAKHQGAMDCIIRDISPYGARIEFSQPSICPSELTLQVGTGDNVRERVDCTVKWSKGKQLGLQFARKAAAAK